MNPDDTLTLTLTVDRRRLREEGSQTEVENLVYNLAATIFEFGGEYNRGEDGHTAQRLAEAAGKEWARGAKLARDLLDARDRLAAVERERDGWRVAALALLAALDAHEDAADEARGAHYNAGQEDAVYKAKSDLRDALTGAPS